jgi:hypothetical protein
MKRRRKIVYWEFNVDIVGPRLGSKAKRQKLRKVLSPRRLRAIEAAALAATRAKLPAGFRAVLS